ncbi:AAA family ATPase [uncultured Fibrobacter sp.]|uniref:AAA family ATPase n=1 Tax=uncultured Fibrobacter sp. TaxID=261512 RepID=UPI002805961C|nr:AAA family ATPase [uncultured Fibrobacter sp.]
MLNNPTDNVNIVLEKLSLNSDEGKIVENGKKSFGENKSVASHTLPNFSPTQIIYYGVPGCGKSFAVNKKIDSELEKLSISDKEFHKVRCVFHPEYSNADFVGQIYPYVKPDNGGVEYRFKPGPFTKIIRRAYLNPTKPFFLIIEEINRGNAAAIFGEMFQLLDRIESDDEPDKSTENVYGVGWSSYGVNNDDVNAYIRQDKTGNIDEISYAGTVSYKDQIKFSLNTAIRLPPNLSIYGTMNTSDQNVFTMDNAFQRRFQSKMIRNNLTDTNQYNLRIGDTEVCWGDFRKWINKKILAPETGLVKAEDKCLGGWFIKGKKNGNIPKDEFAEKVLKYLWNDVFKRHVAESVFNKEVHSLMSLIESFESNAGFAAFESTFALADEDKKALKPGKENA